MIYNIITVIENDIDKNKQTNSRKAERLRGKHYDEFKS